MSACVQCGHDEEAAPTLTARLADRREVGSCLSCPHDAPYRNVWVIMTGCVEVRFCQKHMIALRKMTATAR